MKKIVPYFDNPPAELWEDATKKRSHSKNNPLGQSKIIRALTQEGKNDFDNNVYGSTIVKRQLRVIFNDKCAFCETNTNAGAYHDVEHFRFKNHYYWLGYEWTNLLLSCQICNQTFKRTQFPLEEERNRISQPPLDETGILDTSKCHILHESLLAERPLLLHPAIDNPKLHLRFLPNGSVEGISVKGRESIDVYGLKRDELVKKRKSIIKHYQKELEREYQYNPIPNRERIKIEIQKLIGKLIECTEDQTTEYWGFHIAILENFEEFIIDNTTNGIDLPDKEIMREASRLMLNFE